MRDHPRVSVLLTAYKRDDYLPFALDSLRAQSLPAEDFEVLISAQTVPSTLSRHMEGLNVRWLSPPTSDLGMTLASGLRTCQGEIVAVLDDDDMFYPRKLEVVLRTFESDPDLGYLHNNFSVVDGRGSPVDPHPLYAREREAVRELGPLRLTPPDPWATLKGLPRVNLDFNGSSICFRRSIVQGRLGTLEQIPQTVEPFFFVASVLDGRPVRLDSATLTYYRVHATNISIAGPEADALRRVREFSARALPGLTAIAAMARASGNVAAARETEAAARLCRFYQAFQDERLNRGGAWRAWRDARELRDTLNWLSEREVTPAVLLYVLSPRMAHRIYRWRLTSNVRWP